MKRKTMYATREEAEKARPYVVAVKNADGSYSVVDSFRTRKQANEFEKLGIVMTRKQMNLKNWAL